MKRAISILLAVMMVFGIFAVNVSAIDVPVKSRENVVKIISGVTGDKNGGTVTPKTSEYSPGEDVTFHIIPNKGYKIKQVWVNGVAIGPVSKYTFYNIQEDSTIFAEFEKIEKGGKEETTAKKNEKNISPDTGANMNTFVLCVLGSMMIGSVAAVTVAKKSRKEEY